MSSANQEYQIQIENLCKVYKVKRGKVKALENVSLSVRRGEVFGFLGPNGAGKSTTIKTLMGLLNPTSGSVLLCGTKTTEASARKHVGFLPENPAFYDFLSAREYLRFVAASFNMQASEVEKRIDAVFEQLDLTAAAKRPIRSYSKGMVQRLGLAQVLLHDPDVYILDEPMSGLDPQGRALVKELIRDLKFAGKTVFFSTHITADIEKVCDRMAIIVGGKICANADVEEVMRSGVERYRLISTPKDDSLGERHEFQVAAAELPSKMAELTAAGEVLQLVEPLGRDLENYFLDIVRQHSA